LALPRSTASGHRIISPSWPTWSNRTQMAPYRAAAGTADCLLSETHVARAKTRATTCSHPLSSGAPYPPF
ncbi:MAG TPA: hypothetical protein VGD83_00180, partial [Streptosporangiaceae bacterium]